MLALFAVMSLVEAFGVGHVIRFLPLYLRAIGTPATDVPEWTGILSACTFVFGLPLVPFWGVWGDRYSRKLVIARSAFVEAVVFAGVGLSQNHYQLAVALSLVGFQLGNTGIMLTCLRAVTPVHRLGLAISIFGLTPPVGLALGPAIGGFLVDGLNVPLRALYGMDSVLSVAAGVMLLVFFRDVAPVTAPSGSAVALALDAVRQVLVTRITRTLFVIYGFALLGFQTAGPFFPFLVERLHPGSGSLATAIGLVFGVSVVTGSLLSPIAGIAGDRRGFRPVLVGALAVSAASLASMAFIPNLGLLTVSAVFFSAGTASAGSMILALLATAVPEERRSATLNLSYVPLYLAGIAGGSLGALLARAGVNAVILAAAALFLAGMGMAYRQVPPRAHMRERGQVLAEE